MSRKKPKLGQSITGAGGVLLIVSLFLPWAGGGAKADRTGFALLAMGDVFLLVVGLVAIGAALTWGRFGLFRADVSTNGAADLLGVAATIAVAYLIFDFPSGASREIGVFLALVAAIAIAGGAGDYSTLRGAPLFPRIDADESRTPGRI